MATSESSSKLLNDYTWKFNSSLDPDFVITSSMYPFMIRNLLIQKLTESGFSTTDLGDSLSVACDAIASLMERRIVTECVNAKLLYEDSGERSSSEVQFLNRCLKMADLL